MASNTPSSGSSGRENGFTLIELLVSLTILTVVLGLLSSALRTLSQNWNANADRIERLEMVSRAFDIFTRDVSGFQRLISTSNDKPRFIFTGTQNRLSFVTIEPPYPTSPGAYFVDYSVVPNGPAFDLVRARAPYQTKMQAFPGATPANIVPLLQGRFKYQFSYAQKGTPDGPWLASWRKQNRLPDLIRLEIIDAERGTDVFQPFVVALRTDAEFGCLAEGSDRCSAKTGGQISQDGAQNAMLGQAGR
ncbi:prepilin-type N-terminal cleavage/methylation domain-containing protein [Hyphomicrobium sp.]|jgi:general secretion pathway protein J|uniref:prepilin-type N-terminal cleavage/methylation domain-containing protein n=1 Tax=Hyphomicrobium sp. TaxID=82 RepID=UPI003568276C